MKKIILPVIIILSLLLCSGIGAFAFTAYQAYRTGDYTKLAFFVSWLNGKQKDLGITYTDKQATDFLDKNSIITTNTCPQDSTCSNTAPSYFGSTTITTELTNEEGTALINHWIGLSKNAPFTSAQMRVNSDGSVDFAATVDMNRLNNFSSQSQVPTDVKNSALKYVGALGNSFPIYAHGTLDISNGQVNSHFTEVKVGFISIPSNIFTDQKNSIDSFVEDRLKQVPSLSITELSFKNGKTVYKGTVPKTIVFKK